MANAETPGGGGSGIGLDSDYMAWSEELSRKLQRFYDKFMTEPDPPGPEGVPPGKREEYADLSSYVERFRYATATEQFSDLLAPEKSIISDIVKAGQKVRSSGAYSDNASANGSYVSDEAATLRMITNRLDGWEGDAKYEFDKWLTEVHNSIHEFAVVKSVLAACAEHYRDLIKKTRQDVLNILELAIEGSPVNASEKVGLVLTSIGFIVSIGPTIATGGLSGAAVAAVFGTTLSFSGGAAASESQENNKIEISENDLMYRRRAAAISEFDRLERETENQCEMIQSVVKKVADSLAGKSIAQSVNLVPPEPQIPDSKGDDFKLQDEIRQILYG